MWIKFAKKLRDAVKAWITRWRPVQKFADGSSLTEIHQYCIRYVDADGRFVDIGFEAAVEPEVDNLIHESTIERWSLPQGQLISPADRARIMTRLVEYCESHSLRFRVVP